MAKLRSHNHAAPSAGNVHRFGDMVATALPGMPDTIYLSASEARAYARALNRAARSVETERFVDSECTTIVRFARTDRFREFAKGISLSRMPS